MIENLRLPLKIDLDLSSRPIKKMEFGLIILFQEIQFFDHILDVETTGEIRFRLDKLQTKRNFIGYMNCSE
jgi:hypothetical protein